jgi:hypothetical protein
MRNYDQLTKMAHKLPTQEKSALFFFILGYLGDDMPDGIKEEIERRYMKAKEESME